MLRDVTTYYLEITDRSALRAPRSLDLPCEIRQARIPLPELNRFLFVAVGRDWHWRARLKWTRDQWLTYMGRPELETWVAYVDGTPAGYYEQDLQPESGAEIVNFGLLPQFTGQGWGGQLLAHAIQRGWARGAQRVWLHTCTLDHPQARAHYMARGMRQYDEQTINREVDDGPVHWPEI